jgi:cation diffusion facilitator CzcD-associated flavoprotein CzcO
VIGTGASAIQFVPEIAGRAAQVDVYQRSAPYVIPRPDRRYGERTRRLLDDVPGLRSASRLRHYLQYETRALALITAPVLMKAMHKRWERFLHREVADPALREKLTPAYEMGCKRILISNDWYPTLCRDDVEVIDTGIERITPSGIATRDGCERPADVIIFGTGFRTLEFLAPMAVTGRAGRDLHASWHEGAEAYLGTTVAGFPNFFLVYGPNTNLVHNSIIYMIESQVAYIADALRILERDDLAWLDVRAEVQRRWNETLREKSSGTLFESGCSSWYTTASGRNTNNWTGYTFDYRRRTRAVNLDDYEAMPRRRVPAPVGAEV